MMSFEGPMQITRHTRVGHLTGIFVVTLISRLQQPSSSSHKAASRAFAAKSEAVEVVVPRHTSYAAINEQVLLRSSRVECSGRSNPDSYRTRGVY